ncbi:hypothetical protein H9P43_002027 [Blastocladiella emersonii ATCC 22665]|nr:hypothetical protein H9P43_002027 [Blastocladiella emersonii ATCC 22665]
MDPNEEQSPERAPLPSNSSQAEAEPEMPPSRSIRLYWPGDARSPVNYRRELEDQCPNAYQVHVSSALIRTGQDSDVYERQLAILDFYDIRDAQAALKRWNGRTEWGVRVEGHYMLPDMPAKERTPCKKPGNQGSLRIDLRSFDVVQEQGNGSLVVFAEYFSKRERLIALKALERERSGDYTIHVQLAWDQSSVDIP